MATQSRTDMPDKEKKGWLLKEKNLDLHQADVIEESGPANSQKFKPSESTSQIATEQMRDSNRRVR